MTSRFLMFLPLLALSGAQLKQGYVDRMHMSKVLGEARHYRLFLPPEYDSTTRRYPVIYYFHGHSDRYTLERYDEGKDTVPKIAEFVRTHPVIVVAVDGYVARDYEGFYGGSPWDVRENGGQYDFGLYFQELVRHIDGEYRTLATRRSRATSGLSMGGFMSLYLSARFPDLIGSASSFNSGPEFYAGGKGRLVLWRPKDHVSNHTATMVRLIRASGDYISQYHEETHAAYAVRPDVEFEYRRDEYHRHWATSIGETFEFHQRAFAASRLDEAPAVWHHSDAFERFSVWGYEVHAAGTGPGLVYLQDVSKSGMRITTRKWAPDGPPVEDRRLEVTTAPHYRPAETYILVDRAFAKESTSRTRIQAGQDGRLKFSVDGAGHQITLEGPGLTPSGPVLLPLTKGDVPRLPAAADVALPVRLYNPRAEPLSNVRVKLSSEYPTVALRQSELVVAKIEAGGVVDLSKQLTARFTEGEGSFEHTRLVLELGWGDKQTSSQNIDLLVEPEGIPSPYEVKILDGRKATFTVFHQKGNQGGGNAHRAGSDRGQGQWQRHPGTWRRGDHLGAAAPGIGPVRQRELVSGEGLHRLTMGDRDRRSGRGQAARVDRRQGADKRDSALCRDARRRASAAAAG